MPPPTVTPKTERDQNLRLGFPIFDAEQLNYFVSLRRTYSISLKDLSATFNHRYQRETKEEEIENLIEEAERSAVQLREGNEIAAVSIFSHPAVRAAIDFWPRDGFEEDENHKLFMLACYRHAFDLTCKKLEEEGKPHPTARTKSNAPPARRLGKIRYEHIKDFDYWQLFDLYLWRMDQITTTKANEGAKAT
ncbi:MAG: hypothetical protein Q9200_001107 [Gallowayella weberi]